MELSVTQGQLARAVNLAAQAAASKSTLAILGNLLLSADRTAGTLQITGLDLEMALTVEIPATVQEAGAVTLPAGLLRELVSGIPAEQTVNMVLRTQRMAVDFSWGRARSQIKGIDASDYPLIPKLDGAAVTLDVTGGDLGQLLNRALLATADAKDTSRPALTGVMFGGSERLTCAATDGYRLSVAQHADLPPGGGQIVPGESLKLAERLSNEASGVAVRFGKHQVMFAFSGTEKAGWTTATLISQTIDAKFPDYRAIVPTMAGTVVEVDAGQLARTLRLAGLFAKDSSMLVRLIAQPGIADDLSHLCVRTESAESGNFEQELEATVTGSMIEAAFNVVYLLDGLKALGGPTARLELSRADRPLKITAPDFTYVVMPMQIK